MWDSPPVSDQKLAEGFSLNLDGNVEPKQLKRRFNYSASCFYGNKSNKPRNHDHVACVNYKLVSWRALEYFYF